MPLLEKDGLSISEGIFGQSLLFIIIFLFHFSGLTTIF